MGSVFDEAAEILRAKSREISDLGGMPLHLKMNGVDNPFVLAHRPNAGEKTAPHMLALAAVIAGAYEDWKFEQQEEGRDVDKLPGLFTSVESNKISIMFAAGEFKNGPPLRVIEQEVLSTKAYIFPKNYNDKRSPIRLVDETTVGVVMSDPARAADMREMLSALGDAHEVDGGFVKGMRVMQPSQAQNDVFYIVQLDRQKYEAIRDIERGTAPDLPGH